MLERNSPRAYRSLTYNQSGFKLKNTSGRPVLWLSKIGENPIHLHRAIPENAMINQITVKREPTGDWFAPIGIDVDGDTREKPENPNRDVGVDVGILNHPHDTDKTAVESPDSSDEGERLERAHRWWGTKIEYVVAKYDIGLERISIDFDLASADGTGPITDTALVKSGTLAPSKKCAIVELRIKIGDRWHWTTANFEGRSQMQYLVILGRVIWGLSR